jgi:hypothetical protein
VTARLPAMAGIVNVVALFLVLGAVAVVAVLLVLALSRTR